ncbi:MAG: phenylalanine--tRNA ligase subunit beta [bacterium]
MKVSWNWLEDWIDLSDLSVTQVVDKLTLAGVEVASVTEIYDPKIVVGRIDEIQPHPKADKLVMCRVDVGESELKNIACGAKNMVAGDLVPVALDGAKPPGIDFEIVSRPVAGVVSEGMLCAEEELGLARESAGLWILPKGLTVGQNIFDATKTRDVVIEVELTPNRSDCLSHLGIARELAALFERELRCPDVPPLTSSALAIGEVASLEVRDAQGCPQYGMAVLENVKMGPSPEWLRHRLAKVGSRSINNVVDVTNYVLLHVGQPLHAFDLDKVEGGIVVRRAQPGESMQGIDHKTHTLDENDLVIADHTRAVAIAGVMGGEGTEVTDTTTRVLIECAQFHPTTVRKTAKRLGLHTESSHRFERGIDAKAVMSNLELAVALMVGVQAGDVAPVVRSGRLTHVAAEPVNPVVDVSAGRVNQILGTNLSTDDVASLLGRLGIQSVVDGAQVRATIPSWRPDLSRPIDLTEEVARIYGYDKLLPTSPRIPMGHIHRTRVQPGHAPTIITRSRLGHVRRIRTSLLNLGFAEAMNYSFYGEDDQRLLGLSEDDVRAQPRRVANPLAADQALMRTTLLPGLLKALATNVSRRQKRLALFESGRAYLATGEQEHVSGVAFGSRLGHIGEPRDWDFFDLKGVVETLAEPFSGAIRWSSQCDEPFLHPGVRAVAYKGEVAIATVGQLHPQITRTLDVEKPVFYFDVDVDALTKLGEQEHKYVAMTKYPAVERDFAFVVGRDVPFAKLDAAIRSASDWLESVSLFDVYTGPQVPDDKQSCAVAVAYRAPDRTLTDVEIQEVDAAIVESVAKATGAVLR